MLVANLMQEGIVFSHECSRVMARSTAAIACWLLVAGVAAGQPIVILEQPVRVIATPQDPTPGGGWYLFDLAVEYGDQRCDLVTAVLVPGDEGERLAWEHLRRTIGWKGDYLFVLSECGAGNTWKCASEAVFMLRDERLVALGSLLARGPAHPGESDEIGTSYRYGAFIDIYADYESNDLTSHAGAPRFDVVLLEQEGKLVPDLLRTWDLNRNLYEHNFRISRPSPDEDPTSSGYERIYAWLPNAVLAKYCNRQVELAETLAEARAALPADVMQVFEAELAGVEAGVLPRRSRLTLR
ncbi:MAG: hypothetical protein IPP62_16390 [bacterium]|nr:hypothetical protein [bacterium]